MGHMCWFIGRSQDIQEEILIMTMAEETRTKKNVKATATIDKKLTAFTVVLSGTGSERMF